MQYVSLKLDGKIIFWSLVILCSGIFFLLFSDMCFPFVVGFFLAYLFAPSVENLSKYFNRPLISLFFTMLVVLVFAFVATESLPRIKGYLLLLNQKFPLYYSHFLDFLKELNIDVDQYRLESLNVKYSLQKYVDNNAYTIASWVGKIASKGNIIVGFFSFFFIMPISLYYFLKDWPALTKFFYELIPHRHREIFVEAGKIARESLRKFFIGQSYVVCFLSCYYAFFLYCIKIPNFISLGVMSGLFSFIPCIGAFFSLFFVIFINVPLLTITKLYVLIGTYFLGQFIEGYILYPKLVGKNTGLHPLLVLFSFFAGIQVKGIIGVLLAIPLTTVLQNLLYFALSKVRASQFFKQ